MNAYRKAWEQIVKPSRLTYCDNFEFSYPDEMEGVPIRKLEFMIGSSDKKHKIKACLICARDTLPETIAVYMHTFSGNKMEGRFLMDHFLPNIGVLLFDSLGCGNAEGEFVTLGLREKDDLGEVLRELQKSVGFDKVLLYGRSMGAASIIHFLAKFHAVGREHRPEGFREEAYNVVGVVLDSPFTDVYRLIQEIMRRKGHSHFMTTLMLYPVAGSLRSNVGYDVLDGNKPIDQVEKIKVPAFFLIGSADDMINQAEFRRMFGLYGARIKHLEVMEDVTHPQERDPKFIQKAIDFLFSALENFLKRGRSSLGLETQSTIGSLSGSKRLDTLISVASPSKILGPAPIRGAIQGVNLFKRVSKSSQPSVFAHGGRHIGSFEEIEALKCSVGVQREGRAEGEKGKGGSNSSFEAEIDQAGNPANDLFKFSQRARNFFFGKENCNPSRSSDPIKRNEPHVSESRGGPSSPGAKTFRPSIGNLEDRARAKSSNVMGHSQVCPPDPRQTLGRPAKSPFVPFSPNPKDSQLELTSTRSLSVFALPESSFSNLTPATSMRDQTVLLNPNPPPVKRRQLANDFTQPQKPLVFAEILAIANKKQNIGSLQNLPQNLPQTQAKTHSQTNLQTHPQNNTQTNLQTHPQNLPRNVPQNLPQNLSQNPPQNFPQNFPQAQTFTQLSTTGSQTNLRIPQSPIFPLYSSNQMISIPQKLTYNSEQLSHQAFAAQPQNVVFMTPSLRNNPL